MISPNLIYSLSHNCSISKFVVCSLDNSASKKALHRPHGLVTRQFNYNCSLFLWGMINYQKNYIYVVTRKQCDEKTIPGIISELNPIEML